MSSIAHITRVLSLRTERLEVCGGLFSSQNSVQKTEMTIAIPTKSLQSVFEVVWSEVNLRKLISMGTSARKNVNLSVMKRSGVTITTTHTVLLIVITLFAVRDVITMARYSDHPVY
jgi:hypothetical protein